MVASPRTSDSSLRRAAILLSHLDAESRRRLLAHLSPRQAANLRAAAASLTDVDPLEVRRTVSAFVGRISIARPPAAVDAAAPSETEAGAQAASAGEPSTEDDAVKPSGGLQFLHNVADATLLRAVQSEHPQTIAVVLASIDPKQAARLLKRLEPQQRSEAIRRLGKLEDVPQDAIEDIGRHLRDLIGTLEQLGSGEGRRKLASIFSELGAEDRRWLDQSVGSSDGVIAAALADAEQASPTQSQPARQAAANGAESRGANDQYDSPRILTMDRPRAASGAGSAQARAHPAGDSRHSQGEAPSDQAAPHQLGLDSGESASADADGEFSEALPALSPDEVDAVLERLTPRELQGLLAELPARESLLTVCGLSRRSVRRLLRAMPRRQAKAVRQRLEELGPLELREIDQAKRAAAAVVLGAAPQRAGESVRRAA